MHNQSYLLLCGLDTAQRVSGTVVPIIRRPSNCLCRVDTAQRVSGTVVPIIRSPLQLSLSRRHRSTCFGHCCAHHQEPPSTAFVA
jgi:hypothetical protein